MSFEISDRTIIIVSLCSITIGAVHCSTIPRRPDTFDGGLPLECRGFDGLPAERCNMADDDCDGKIDEDYPQVLRGDSCTSSCRQDPGTGRDTVCFTGLWVCRDGQPICAPGREASSWDMCTVEPKADTACP